MSSTTARLLLAAVGFIALCHSPASAQQRFYSLEERVLIGDGGLLHAVAAGPFDVYAAADFGIVVFDGARERWKTPLPLPVEMIGTRPTALAFDPAAGALWLGTAAGDVFTSAPGFDRWDRMSGFRGPIESIVAWPTEGAVYILAGGEWQRINAGSFFPEPVPVNGLPGGVAAAATRLPDDPWFRAARGTLGLDPRNRRWDLLDVAAGRLPGQYWLATAGGGLVRYDSRSGRADWFRFGLATPGAATVAKLDETLWFGSDGRVGEGGVAWSSTDLGAWGQQFRQDGAPGGFVAEAVRFAGATWFASSDGLFRLAAPPGTDRRGDWRRTTTADGLASDRVRSLAVRADLLWAGTDRGLTPFDSTGTAIREAFLTGQRVSRMATRGDTLFIASDRGLLTLVVRNRRAATNALPEPIGRIPVLRGRVTDVVADDSLMFVIAGNAIFDVNGPGTPVRDAVLDRIGAPVRLALRDGQLWAAGPRGIARRDPGTHSWQSFTVPEDVHAGPVSDVLPDGDHVWAATPAGAVRLRWR